jgi:hypothetical protein
MECEFVYIYEGFLSFSSAVSRAIAETVSRWLPTAEARVCPRVWQVGFVVDEVASG